MQLVVSHGHVGRNPRFNHVGQKETPVLNFTLGVNDYRGDGETAVCWFKCTLWGDHAENIHQWIVQGKELIIQGRLTADEYGNPPTYESNDGDTRASFNLTVDRLNFAGSRGDSSEDVDDEEEDEIPF